IEATDPPDEERVVSRYLPGLPSDTLLQAAVVHGHVEVVEQLIRSGAEVDTRTPGRQTPLMLAVQQSRGAIAERLIAHGADVDAVAGRGMTALHLAAKREDRPMMDLLVAAGARTDATDAHGWTAAQWLAHAEAEVRPRPTGPLRIVDPHGNALDGGPALATPARQPGTAGEPLQTGIKALDLLAPLARGRVTRVVGGPFVGKIVLLAEVMRRFAPPVIATFLDRSWTVRDFDHVLRECNVHPGARVVVGSDPSRAAELAAAALAHAEALGSIVVADDRLMHALRAASPGVPVLAFSPNAHESDPELEVDGQWVLSHELARDGRWPAVDPDRSEVAWPRRAEDASIAREARRVLAEGGPRAERLAAYLTQPFHVAYVTGIPGAVVPWSSARADVARILAGELDARPLDGLGFSGALASH
ncbi:MAG: ankyrin repeat domain-containing protein, partial [Myxococcota bacterium]